MTSTDWDWGAVTAGCVECRLHSWSAFGEFINEDMLKFTSYVYRGQADATWDLRPALNRSPNPATVAEIANEMPHLTLSRFQAASRGRRGTNPKTLDEDEWWAVGQHHGLQTPLLDWTESPFVALFFAFVEKRDCESRVVVALAEPMVEFRSTQLLWKHDIEMNRQESEKSPMESLSIRNPGKVTPTLGLLDRLSAPQSLPPDTVSFVRPDLDENARLTSQRGLFTKGPRTMSIEDWVNNNFQEEQKKYVLIKILLPNDNRENCLRYLNRMNINYLSLFPDLEGASRHCNMHREISNY